MIRRPRVKDPKHLAWVRTLPCVITDDNTSVEAAHVRYPDSRYLKRETGMGEKPDDCWVVPLSGVKHREQHSAGTGGNGEKLWWHGYCINPVHLAFLLHKHSGDTELVPQIYRAARDV